MTFQNNLIYESATRVQRGFSCVVASILVIASGGPVESELERAEGKETEEAVLAQYWSAEVLVVKRKGRACRRRAPPSAAPRRAP